jgi:CheY-like chemotaxis protein
MQRMMLESAGFRVLTASSGAEALRIFKSKPIDVVVMDYLMPGMSGTVAASIMKRLKPDVPIVFLSAYQELPGETLGIANAWVKKGEEEPEFFVARLRSLTDEPNRQARAS